MKKVIFLLAIIILCYGCAKDNTEISKFVTGTYYGEKVIHYFSTNITTTDTLTIKFDSIKHMYSGSDALDYGKGRYSFKNDSVEFNDELARNALYSWDWILGGMYKYRIIDDSMILNRRYFNRQIIYRLKKITK